MLLKVTWCVFETGKDFDQTVSVLKYWITIRTGNFDIEEYLTVGHWLFERVVPLSWTIWGYNLTTCIAYQNVKKSNLYTCISTKYDIALSVYDLDVLFLLFFYFWGYFHILQAQLICSYGILQEAVLITKQRERNQVFT